MEPTDRIVLAHLAFPLNGRTRKEIVARTGIANMGTVDGSLARLRKTGLLEGWDVTERGRRTLNSTEADR